MMKKQNSPKQRPKGKSPNILDQGSLDQPFWKLKYMEDSFDTFTNKIRFNSSLCSNTTTIWLLIYAAF